MNKNIYKIIAQKSVPRKNKIPTVDEVIAFSLTKIK